MRKSLYIAVLSLCFAFSLSLPASDAPASPAQDGTLPALTAIAGQGMMSSESYDDLAELSDYIGGRVTASPEAAKAIEWGVAKMHAIGLENVHTETWKLSRGWTRVSADAELLSPIRRRLIVDSMGWVGSTPRGGTEAEVVEVDLNKLDEEMKQNAGSWSGKVLLIVRKGPAPTGPEAMNASSKFSAFLKTVESAHVVVVGGHLDSWDLAQGATDDGCGVATTLGAAKAIKLSGFHPKRTLRFVLFTGEEQGLLGSLAYTKTHKDEMANHVAALILDNGQGPVVRLNLGGRDDLVPALSKFADSVKGFGELEVDDRPTFGTDAGPFVLAGLPGINMGQDSPEYKFTHHSAVDTLDKVKPEMMIRDSAMMALAAFWIADRPERLASPWPPEKTARMLVEKHQDQNLKTYGIWPFGDLGSQPQAQPAAGKTDK